MSSFNHEPSATYLQAVDALRTLMKEEGVDLVTRAFADATWEAKRDSYVKHEGLKHNESGHVCFHRLKGQRCPDEECCSPTCIPGSDHVSEWKKDGETYVIVSQPYSLSYETMKETVAFCEAHDLKADISGSPSWHFPAAVITVEYKRMKPTR